MARVQFSFTPGKVRVDNEEAGYPMTLPEDATCIRCGDPYNAMELEKGRCFSCRYSKQLRTWR